jgi:hypothetical protein
MEIVHEENSEYTESSIGGPMPAAAQSARKAGDNSGVRFSF